MNRVFRNQSKQVLNQIHTIQSNIKVIDEHVKSKRPSRGPELPIEISNLMLGFFTKPKENVFDRLKKSKEEIRLGKLGIKIPKVRSVSKGSKGKKK